MWPQKCLTGTGRLRGGETLAVEEAETLVWEEFSEVNENSIPLALKKYGETVTRIARGYQCVYHAAYVRDAVDLNWGYRWMMEGALQGPPESIDIPSLKKVESEDF